MTSDPGLRDARSVTVRESETASRLAAIVDSSDDAILAKDLNGTIIAWNAAAERLFGYAADEAIGKPVFMLIPADRSDEEPTILARVRAGERIDHYETVRMHKDGSLIDISLSVSPIRGPDGTIIGASKIARDITERRQAEEQQRLVIREMDHRVKNLFTVASSVLALSARSSSTVTELVDTVSARLSALGRAHALTTPSTGGATDKGRKTTLHALIRTILAPYDGVSDSGPTISIAGPDVPIGSGALTNFALLLHEFATNAAKYGALSSFDGRIDISCIEEGDRFTLTWAESGGPQIHRQSDFEGFGTRLVKGTVKGQFGGDISHDWKPDGLTIRLVVDRGRLTA